MIILSMAFSNENLWHRVRIRLVRGGCLEHAWLESKTFDTLPQPSAGNFDVTGHIRYHSQGNDKEDTIEAWHGIILELYKSFFHETMRLEYLQRRSPHRIVCV